MRQHRVVILTDLHLKSSGVYGYLNAQIDTLLRLVNRKIAHTVVINGDVFDRRNPRGREMLALKSLIDGIKAKQIIINTGNHDCITKDMSMDTTLSLYESDRVKVVTKAEIIPIANIPFAFIPHSEDENKIIQDIKDTDPHPLFGHFGFDGSVANGSYLYDSYVKKAHFKDRLTFLGHIHKPMQYKSNIYMLGTQYSCSFGEANSQKYIHELIIRDNEIEVVKKPIDFGIKHIVCTLDEVEDMDKKYGFRNYFTLLRVKVDTLDSFAEEKIKENILSNYDVAHLEIVFEDILPKLGPGHSLMGGSKLSIDDAMIEKYVKESSTIFSDEDIFDSLDIIKNYK